LLTDISFGALTLLVECQKRHWVCKKISHQKSWTEGSLTDVTYVEPSFTGCNLEKNRLVKLNRKQ